MYLALTHVCREALAAGRPTAEQARIFFERNFRPLRITKLGENESKGRQLVTKVAKAAAWSSVGHPPSALQSIGSSAELGSFSGSGRSFGTSVNTERSMG